MLVLSRKSRESIVIDQRITVTVLEVRGDIVRLGITAPREVQVHREEVLAAIRAANRAAASPSPAALQSLAALRRNVGG